MGFVLGAILIALGVEWSRSLPDPSLNADPAVALDESVPPVGEREPLPDADPSALSVYSIPTGAHVLVGPDTVGVTPLWLRDLDNGLYPITVVAEGYAPLDTTVAVDVAQPTSLVLLLSEGSVGGEAARPAPSPPPPSATAPTTPRSPERPATTRPAPPSSRPSAPPPPAAEPSTGSPIAPAPSQSGTLAVTVRPWGTILIDGVVHGREMDVRYETTLPVGTHRVRAVHPILGSREVTVQVRPDAPSSLVIDLNPPNAGASGDGS